MDKLPFLIVGNKCDLVETRVITTEQGQALASELNVAFLETSAKTRLNVDEMFINIVRQIVAFKDQRKPQDTGPGEAKPVKGKKSSKTCQLL
jgi:GTPase SAR1 family protein